MLSKPTPREGASGPLLRLACCMSSSTGRFSASSRSSALRSSLRIWASAMSSPRNQRLYVLSGSSRVMTTSDMWRSTGATAGRVIGGGGGAGVPFPSPLTTLPAGANEGNPIALCSVDRSVRSECAVFKTTVAPTAMAIPSVRQSAFFLRLVFRSPLFPLLREWVSQCCWFPTVSCTQRRRNHADQGCRRA